MQKEIISITETRHLWTGESIDDAISRAMFLAQNMMPDIMALSQGGSADEKTVHSISMKAQMILNLLRPYGDMDAAPDSFKEEVLDLFG